MQSRFPSIKTIMRINGLRNNSAKLVREVMMAGTRTEIAELLRKIENVDHPKIENEIVFNFDLKVREVKMEIIDYIVPGTSGVEEVNDGGYSVMYCNSGSTYGTTILLVNGIFKVGSWGSYIE